MYYLKKNKGGGAKKSNLSSLVKKLDKEFSLFIRLRDSKAFGFKAFKCISCGQIKPFEQADCGHYFSRVKMSTRFDEDNCNCECRKCLTPDALILMKDLTWRKLGDLIEGDEVFSFDEEIIYKTSRRYRVGKVTHIHREVQDVFEVELENGDKVKTTEHHKWLARARQGTSYQWIETSQMWVNGYNLYGKKKTGPHTNRTTTVVCKPFKVVMQDTSRESGWLAGMIDADGHICQQNIKNPDGTLRYGFRVGIAQCEKYMDICSDIKSLLEKFTNNNKTCRQVMDGCMDKRAGISRNYHAWQFLITGTNVEKIQFLQRVRPHKIKKVDIEKLGKLKSQYDTKVRSIRYVGKEEIVVMETDTHTFIANGYAMHNCNRFSADHLEGYRENLIKKIGQPRFDVLRYRSNQTKKWSAFELESLIKYYKEQNKKLKENQ